MKNKYILPGSLVFLIGFGLMATFGDFMPAPKTGTAYGYSSATNQLQESYDRSAETLDNASIARISAEQAFNDSLKAEESAKQSQCSLQIALANSKLIDVGDSDSAEKDRLQASVAAGAQCLLLHSPAFR